jgi:hypothetical protein
MALNKSVIDLKGHVKSAYIEYFNINEENGEFIEKFWFNRSYTFDRDGRVVELRVLNPNGSTWRTIYDYSDDGRIKAVRSYDSSGLSSSAEMQYLYDISNRLIAERAVKNDGSISELATYTYNAEKQKTRIQVFDEPVKETKDTTVAIGIEGSNISVNAHDAKRIETLYDEKDNPIEVKVFNGENRLVSKVVIVRNERGDPVEEIQYAGEIMPSFECSGPDCSLDREAEMTEEEKAELERLFASGTELSKQMFKYNEDGKLIEEKMIMMGMVVHHRIFKYNELGGKAEEIELDEEGKLKRKIIFNREYDENGNWIKEMVSCASSWDAEFQLSIPNNSTHRKIVYY